MQDIQSRNELVMRETKERIRREEEQLRKTLRRIQLEVEQMQELLVEQRLGDLSRRAESSLRYLSEVSSLSLYAAGLREVEKTLQFVVTGSTEG
jgi:hypothetical protein